MRTLRSSIVALALAGGLTACSAADPQAPGGSTQDIAAPDEVAAAADDGTDDRGGAAAGRVPSLLPGPDGVDHWDETTVTLADGALTIAAKVADDGERRAQGLMRVPALPDDAGMLFLFEGPRQGGFWMKDTLVPLDIAYLRDGAIVSVRQMEPCTSEPCEIYEPGTSYDAALEVRQGLLAEAGVDVGDAATWTDPVEVG